MMMLALAAPNPHSLDAPRKAYAACIRGFETKRIAAKMDAAAYSSALKGSCTAEAGALAGAGIGALAIAEDEPELAGKSIDLSKTYTNELVKRANAKYK